MIVDDKGSKVHLPRLSNSRSGRQDPEESPFYIPDDSEIFRMKEKEKDKKKEQRTKLNNQKIWEKGIKAKDGITMKDLKQMTKVIEQQQSTSKTTLIEAAKSAIKNRVKSNEPMHQFIDKKREMLLFQMLIDHKRQQISEFQELTRLHRKGLQRAEGMLEEDMQTFNNHLNDNKREARDAIKKAEMQTRSKNEKASVIKEKLEVKADLTGKNSSKLQTLENLKKYKDFLDSLRPDNMESTKIKKQKKISEFHQKLLSNQSLNINPQILQFLQENDENEEMYFKDPAQLVNMFLNLEESNLFLMTNSKIIQQSIEVVRNSFVHKKKVLDSKKAELIITKQDLAKQIANVEKEIQHLKINTNKDDFSELFTFLEGEIIKMSRQYGDKNIFDQKPSGLEILKDIQKKLQYLVNTLNQARLQCIQERQASPTLIQKYERQCFTEKRQQKKKKANEEMQQLALQQKIQEAPKRQKRMGRPIMAKSKLKKEQKQQKIEDQGPKEEEIQRRKYLT